MQAECLMTSFKIKGLYIYPDCARIVDGLGSFCFDMYLCISFILFLSTFLLEMGWELRLDPSLGGWYFLSQAADSGPLGCVSLGPISFFKLSDPVKSYFLQLTGDASHLGCDVDPTVLSLIVPYSVMKQPLNVKTKQVILLHKNIFGTYLGMYLPTYLPVMEQGRAWISSNCCAFFGITLEQSSLITW